MLSERGATLTDGLPQWLAADALDMPPGAASSDAVDVRTMNWENVRSSGRVHRIPPLIGPFLSRSLASRFAAHKERLKDCARGCSEESVHQLRVATRRFLAQLALLDGLVPAKTLKRTRKLLKERLSALGELRDTHVKKLAIQEHSLRFKGLLTLHAFLERLERRLVKVAAREVGGWKARKVEAWVLEMDTALDETAANLASQRHCLEVVLGSMREAHTEALTRLEGVDASDPSTIHRVRVAFKKFRYMVESMSPDFSGLSPRALRALANYQRRMGIIQDLEVLRDYVLDYKRRHDPRSESLTAYANYLERRRKRAVNSFIRNAERVRDFWPLPGMPVSPLIGA